MREKILLNNPNKVLQVTFDPPGAFASAKPPGGPNAPEHNVNRQTNMITFDKGNYRFIFRTAGVIIYGNKVLIHKAESDDFWALPGGRVEMGESSEIAIIREMEEEISLLFKVVRPLWVLENFFDHQEKKCHELSIIFLLQCLDEETLLKRGNEFTGLEDSDIILIYKWFKIQTLEYEPLYPSFLRKELGSIPESIQYRIHKDSETG